MMSSTPTFAGLTAAVLALLEAGTGRPIGDHKAPGADVSALDFPYGVLRRTSVGDTEGPIVGPGEIVRVTYELTCVGQRRDQAEALADRAQGVMLDRTSSGFTHALVVAGLNVMNRRLGEVPPLDTEGPIVNDLRGYVLTVSVL